VRHDERVVVLLVAARVSDSSPGYRRRQEQGWVRFAVLGIRGGRRQLAPPSVAGALLES
jgi:hypothetical protein